MAVLLMSCEVSPKWINSKNGSTDKPASFSLMKYSTAFTSWLVVASMAFTRSASASENCSYSARSAG